jgi:hypothetical protein
LLKEMAVTLQKDMDEDGELYDKLACWCRDNSASKKNAINANSGKLSELEATIEELTASSAGLKAKIEELEGEVADNKNTLAKATALRHKELAEFNRDEKDSVANIANLKAAIVVLSKHQSPALLQASATLSFLSLRSESNSDSDEPWGLESKDQRDLDMFMNDNGFGGDVDEDAAPGQTPSSDSRSLRRSQKMQTTKLVQEWSAEDAAAIQQALRSATAFAQKRGKDVSAYVPRYSAQSGEVFGMLKQLQEEMENDLSEAQKLESSRAATFAELREAKTAEIEGGEKSAEAKEDEKAKADFDLSEAKEDLGETKATLEEDTKFLANLKSTCSNADENFENRRKARVAEMTAVGETIEILTADDAKDAMPGTFKEQSFLQMSSSTSSTDLRRRAAQMLRRTAARTGSPELVLLANAAELDAFTKVKAAIDKMIETLTVQQADEVKKNDYCIKELQSNDMATMKAKDQEADLDASVKERQSAVEKFEDEITAAKNEIAKEQASLQTATINRKKDNLDFQKTIADQMLTVAVLQKAMNRLATYYDEQSLIQIRHARTKQTPPVRQMEYKPSEAAGGVLSMIEKLIYDAKEIMADSKKNEADAQAAYEEMVSDSNGTVKALMKSVLSKTNAKAEAEKDRHEKSADLKATQKEISRLGELETDLHSDCDYVMRNFDIRQKATGEEIESLQQAKSVLNGASV